MPKKTDAPFLVERRIELPDRPFFWTTDQVALMLQVSESWLRQRSSYAGRSLVTTRSMLRVVNMAEPDETPVWRVSHNELLRWLAHHGVNITRLTRRTTTPS